MRIAIDCETTGLDLYHSARPFFVTVAIDDNDTTTIRNWQWRVNPLTREVQYEPEDGREIALLIKQADELILHNAKFDYTALRQMDPYIIKWWQWRKVRDTLRMGHLLNSVMDHDLNTMCVEYLGFDMTKYEKKLDNIVKKCRSVCQQARLTKKKQILGRNTKKLRTVFEDWAIAEKGRPDMPSLDHSPHKADMWLPEEMARACGFSDDNTDGVLYKIPVSDFFTCMPEYASIDSLSTINLYKVLRQRIYDKGGNSLWNVYLTAQRCDNLTPEIERRGVSLSGQRLEKQIDDYKAESDECKAVCENIAADYKFPLQMPDGVRNDSLTEFVFDVMKLPVVATTDAGNPALDSKVAIPKYLDTLPLKSVEYAFIESLASKRARDTAIGYMRGYRRFWQSIRDDFYRLHPNLNPTGTNTLRFSSTRPNEQNISARKGFNIRYCFGPAPGREWWSLDYENLELRIPAYGAGEQSMIDLFERPDDPPYFGSNHLLAAHILHPKMFEECINPDLPYPHIDGRIFKDKYKSTWYSWTKNGNFAVQYGAQESSGTADRAYHVVGGQAKIQSRLGKINDLNLQMIEHANKHGFVYTMPDRLVGQTVGYPLYCTTTQWGKVKPTVPLSYHIQGTAMWCTMKAMIRTSNLLRDWREQKGYDGFITMQVHDEIVFDLPKMANPLTDPERSNLWRIKLLKQAMEQSGADINVPLKVSCTYHPDNWSEGESVKIDTKIHKYIPTLSL